MEITTIHTRIRELQCCVIIPTYNNSKTLKKVIDGVLEYTNSIIVVNDGSTDETLSNLKRVRPDQANPST